MQILVDIVKYFDSFGTKEGKTDNFKIELIGYSYVVSELVPNTRQYEQALMVSYNRLPVSSVSFKDDNMHYFIDTKDKLHNLQTPDNKFSIPYEDEDAYFQLSTLYHIDQYEELIKYIIESSKVSINLLVYGNTSKRIETFKKLHKELEL